MSEQEARALACGLAPCPEHGSNCPYHGDEPDRCPWCHCAWAHTLRRIELGTGRHSCESGSLWAKEHKDRPAAALRMRQEATGKAWSADWSLHCTHRVLDIGLVRWQPQLTAQAAE